jgi:ribosome-associated translation inhibitor RaiA
MHERSAPATPTIDMQVVAGIGVPSPERDYAAAMLHRLVESVPGPIRHAQVVLTLDQDPAHQRGAFVEASLDVVGPPVRACVAATNLHQAIDQVSAALARRLDQQHERVSRRLSPQGTATPTPAAPLAGRPTPTSRPTPATGPSRATGPARATIPDLRLPQLTG